MNLEKILKLAEFDTPTVANGWEQLAAADPSAGYTGPDVRAMMPEMGVKVGIAVTARMDTTSPGMDNPPSLFNDWVRLMQKVAREFGPQPVPIFAVMESVGPRPRYTVTIGDRMATQMRMAGAVAFISNGAMRDQEGVADTGLACWAAGLSPMHGKLRWLDVGSPVVIDGMTVRTGDVIHADVNGAMCLPAAVADQVYEKAQGIRDMESQWFEKLAQFDNLDAWLDSQKKK